MTPRGGYTPHSATKVHIWCDCRLQTKTIARTMLPPTTRLARISFRIKKNNENTVAV
jgi:hypothetical protein